VKSGAGPGVAARGSPVCLTWRVGRGDIAARLGEATDTCWTVIEGAAAGRGADRETFARRYVPVVRAYLAARWRGPALAGEIDDAAQEVFVDCFRDGGALGRADRSREGGFRVFLFGVTRNIAMRHERARAKRRAGSSDAAQDPEEIAARDEELSVAFDRAWATSLIRQASARQAEIAAVDGDAALRRLELLRLRFEDGLPIREIAARWGVDPAHLHREYAKARDEFRASLREVVIFHHPAAEAHADAECARLLHVIR
jgi:RNA polymerase sigma factor (sigma-70 family)